MASIRDAVDFAETALGGQIRETGEVYFAHNLRVLAMLQPLVGEDEEILCAAMLNGVITLGENFNQETFTSQFGESVYKIIEALQDPSDGANQYAKFVCQNRFIKEVKNNPKVILIKMADQIDDLSTIESLSNEKKLRKISDVMDHFVPLYEGVLPALTAQETTAFDSLRGTLDTLIKKWLPIVRSS